MKSSFFCYFYYVYNYLSESIQSLNDTDGTYTYTDFVMLATAPKESLTEANINKLQSLSYSPLGKTVLKIF